MGIGIHPEKDVLQDVFGGCLIAGDGQSCSVYQRFVPFIQLTESLKVSVSNASDEPPVRIL